MSDTLEELETIYNTLETARKTLIGIRSNNCLIQRKIRQARRAVIVGKFATSMYIHDIKKKDE